MHLGFKLYRETIGKSGLLSGEYSNEMGLAITKKLTTIRKKKFIIMIVSPYFYLLNKYIAVARSKFLIHLTTPDFLQRGFFDIYGYATKNRMYLRNKYNMVYDKKYVSFSGKYWYDENFVNSIIDPEEYENKKDEAILSITTKKNEKSHIAHRDKLIIHYIDKFKEINNCGASKLCEELKDVLGISLSNVEKIYYKRDERIKS